jgi:hypothetical protein
LISGCLRPLASGQAGCFSAEFGCFPRHGLVYHCRCHQICIINQKNRFMKNLLVLGFVLLSLNGFSQGFMKGLAQRLSFGLKAGGNYSNYVNTNGEFTSDGLAGFHAGALIDFRITNNFYFQEEFLFSTQGAKMNNDLFNKENVQVRYLSVPCLFQFRTNIGLYIEAGAQTSLRLSDNTDKTTFTHFAKQLDMGVAGGIGYLSKAGLGIGVRYVGGVTKVADFNINDVNPSFRNSMAQASIFYIF